MDGFTVKGPPNAFPEGTPIGHEVEGQITHREKTQTINFDTGLPEFWDSGQPKMQWVITLATRDGEQRLFAKGNMLKAIKEAVIKAKCDSLDLGATLKVKRTGQDEPKKRGAKGAWAYEATYTQASVDVDDLV